MIREPPHDSASLHVSGEARYVDDLPEPPGTLHAAIGVSTETFAKLVSSTSSRCGAPGVVAVITAADIPGSNNIGPVLPDEPVFALDRVEFRGQPLFAVAATSVEAARRAAGARAPNTSRTSLSLPSSRLSNDASSSCRPPSSRGIRRSPYKKPAQAALRRAGALYLEGQVALAIPGERGAMLVHSSTQHPTEVQHLVAVALGVPDAKVTVELRRLGGGFGGKETQAALYAVVAALLARATGRPVKLRADRDDDMIGTGKRTTSFTNTKPASTARDASRRST